MKSWFLRWVAPAALGIGCGLLLMPDSLTQSAGADRRRPAPPVPSVGESPPAAAWLTAQLERSDRRTLAVREQMAELAAARRLPPADVPALIEQALDRDSPAWTRPPLLLEILFDRLLRSDPAAARALVEPLHEAASSASPRDAQKLRDRFRAAAAALISAWAAIDPPAARRCLTEWRAAGRWPGTDCELAISAQEFLLDPWGTLETAEPAAAATHFSAAWQRDPAALTAWLSEKAAACSEAECPRIRSILANGLAAADPAAALLILKRSPEPFTTAEAREATENLLDLRMSGQRIEKPDNWREFTDLPESLCSRDLFQHLCWAAGTYWPGSEQHAERLEAMYAAVPHPQRAGFAACAAAAAMDTKNRELVAAWTDRIGPLSAEARMELLSSFARWEQSDAAAAAAWRDGLSPELRLTILAEGSRQ